MTQARRHIIQRRLLDVDVGSQSQADRFLQSVGETWAVAFDQSDAVLFETWDMPDRTIVIDRLVIDLGSVPEDMLIDEVARTYEAALSDELHTVVENAAADQPASTGYGTVVDAARIFMETGSLPWWSPPPDDAEEQRVFHREIEAAFHEWLRLKPTEVAAWAASLKSPVAVMQRAKEQFAPKLQEPLEQALRTVIERRDTFDQEIADVIGFGETRVSNAKDRGAADAPAGGVPDMPSRPGTTEATGRPYGGFADTNAEWPADSMPHDASAPIQANSGAYGQNEASPGGTPEVPIAASGDAKSATAESQQGPTEHGNLADLVADSPDAADPAADHRADEKPSPEALLPSAVAAPDHARMRSAVHDPSDLTVESGRPVARSGSETQRHAAKDGAPGAGQGGREDAESAEVTRRSASGEHQTDATSERVSLTNPSEAGPLPFETSNEVLPPTLAEAGVAWERLGGEKALDPPVSAEKSGLGAADADSASGASPQNKRAEKQHAAKAKAPTTTAVPQDLPLPRGALRGPGQPDQTVNPGAERALASSGEPQLEEHLVYNAGAVLLAPFLPTLFARAGLLAEEGWKSVEAQGRAAQLVHYLVTGEQEQPQYLLMLPMLLAGLEPATALPLDFSPSDDERDEARSLLETVLARWHQMSGTSVKGLRETFLRRTGLLLESSDHWRLRVEPGPYDMLLDTLPWPYRTAMFSWMPKRLEVEW